MTMVQTDSEADRPSDQKTTTITLHMASDHLPHCGYDVDYPTIDQLDVPSQYQSTLEWIEGRCYEQFEPVLDMMDTLIDTGHVNHVGPVEVGTLVYDDEQVIAIIWDDPSEIDVSMPFPNEGTTPDAVPA